MVESQDDRERFVGVIQQEIARMVVDGMDHVGDHRAVEALAGRRDVIRQTKGNMGNRNQPAI